MARIIPFFSKTPIKEKPALKQNQAVVEQPVVPSSALLRQLGDYIKQRAKKKNLGWRLVPALFTIQIAAKDRIRQIREAFEEGETDKLPYHPEFLENFLELRKYFTAAIVFRAADNRKGRSIGERYLSHVQDALEDMNFTALHHPWDWVSFHEAEFEFFLHLAALSQDSSSRFILNRIRKDYLMTSLSFNKNFWDMTGALKVYHTIYEQVYKHDATAAEKTLLDFFDQNDTIILNYYREKIYSAGNAAPDLKILGTNADTVYGTRRTNLMPDDYMPLIRLAFEEDQVQQDVTTLSIFDTPEPAHAYIFCKSQGIQSGLPIAAAAFRHLDKNIKLTELTKDGEALDYGTRVLTIEGNIQSILRAERVALNMLSMLSGIATQTQRVALTLRPLGIKVLDTRKTIPGFRRLSKYAVACGGGFNHRMSLAEMGLIKDNHIAQAGSVKAAIEKFREMYRDIPLEVEIESLEQLTEALAEKPEMILLDNMNSELLKKRTSTIKKFNKENGTEITSEASGGFTPENIEQLANTGVDFVSMGSITNRIVPLDFSLEIEE